MPCTRKDCQGDAWDVFDANGELEIERDDENMVFEDDYAAQMHALRYHSKDIPDDCNMYTKTLMYKWAMGDLRKIRDLCHIPIATMLDDNKRLDALRSNQRLALLIGISTKLDAEIEPILKGRAKLGVMDA